MPIPMVEIDPGDLQDLRDTERIYDAMVEIICGDKMISPLPVLLALKRDAERYRWLREPNNGTDYMAANCPIREDFDAWVDAEMKQSPR